MFTERSELGSTNEAVLHKLIKMFLHQEDTKDADDDPEEKENINPNVTPYIESIESIQGHS